ncbi:MAG TPA: Asp-tRNA(Asn)/Glu-tRNA(Gln) amidotransferase subunit GatB [Kofleriaceae bacterium]
MTWEPVIGLEVHVQLATRSKAFSGSATLFGAPPNSLTDPVVLGLPGSLPAFNRRALEMAITLGLACGSSIRARSRFARKHYFYPDLPKGYQISQYDEPLCQGGAIEVGGRAVRLLRIHLEEDAGKNTHQPGGQLSHVDLNRAGVPLIEVVSEPDIFSAAEAAAYMRELRHLVRWLDISGGDMEKGQLRCDANVSLRPPGSSQLGTRTELKNINSFKFVEDAIEHEITRQAGILDEGGQVVQETRLWDSDAGTSFSMRSKEEAMDYRYFPDPDLPPLDVGGELLARLSGALPALPAALRERFREGGGLTDEHLDFLMAERERAELYASVAGTEDGRIIANYMLLDPDGKAPLPRLQRLAAMQRTGQVSASAAKKVMGEMLAHDREPEEIVASLGLAQVSDAGAIEKIAAEVVAANPSQAASYRAGKTALLGFFVGQLMKKSGGKANPAMASDILKKLLES